MAVADRSDPARSEWDRHDEIIRGLQLDGTLGPALFFYAMSFILLVFSLKRIEISIAYAIWSGLGTAVVAVIGMVYFAEGFNWFKIVCLCLIIMGVISLF